MHATPIQFRPLALALLAAGAIGVGLPASAQTAAVVMKDRSAASAVAGAKTSHRDREFVEMAVNGGKAEITMAQMAQQRATDPQVKAFAEKMATDHGKANDELAKIASSQGFMLPADGKGEDHREHERAAKKLDKLSGSEFDKAYMKHMVEDHKKDVKAFEKAAKSADNAELKGFASRTLPTLQAHLKLAQTTYDGVKAKKM